MSKDYQGDREEIAVLNACMRNDGDTTFAIGSRVSINIFNTIARCYCGKYVFIPEQLKGTTAECVDCAIEKIKKLEQSQTHINMLTGLIQMKKAGY
jgi:hypothetical protein